MILILLRFAKETGNQPEGHNNYNVDQDISSHKNHLLCFGFPILVIFHDGLFGV
jgi:hypothetical protein